MRNNYYTILLICENVFASRKKSLWDTIIINIESINKFSPLFIIKMQVFDKLNSVRQLPGARI